MSENAWLRIVFLDFEVQVPLLQGPGSFTPGLFVEDACAWTPVICGEKYRKSLFVKDP